MGVQGQERAGSRKAGGLLVAYGGINNVFDKSPKTSGQKKKWRSSEVENSADIYVVHLLEFQEAAWQRGDGSKFGELTYWIWSLISITSSIAIGNVGVNIRNIRRTGLMKTLLESVFRVL
jgi:hypothetical protein